MQLELGYDLLNINLEQHILNCLLYFISIGKI